MRTDTIRHTNVIQAIWCLVLFFGVSVTDAWSTDVFPVREIASGVYVHFGKHFAVDHPEREDIANLGFVVGDRCVAVIDTGGSLAVGKALRSAIRQITSLPVCYVINTHVHFDHVLGNAAFAADAPQFLGHAELVRAINSSRDYFAEQFSSEINEDAQAVISPSVTVTDTMTIDLGGRTLRLKAYPPAHTFADLVVFDESTAVLFVSDLVSIKRIPALDGKLVGWLAALGQLKGWQPAPEQIVPGHGSVICGLADAIMPTERYLTTLLNETRDAIANGDDLSHAIERVGRGEKQHWILYESHHGANVTKAYRELEWE